MTCAGCSCRVRPGIATADGGHAGGFGHLVTASATLRWRPLAEPVGLEEGLDVRAVHVPARPGGDRRVRVRLHGARHRADGRRRAATRELLPARRQARRRHDPSPRLAVHGRDRRRPHLLRHPHAEGDVAERRDGHLRRRGSRRAVRAATRVPQAHRAHLDAARPRRPGSPGACAAQADARRRPGADGRRRGHRLPFGQQPRLVPGPARDPRRGSRPNGSWGTARNTPEVWS